MRSGGIGRRWGMGDPEIPEVCSNMVVRRAFYHKHKWWMIYLTTTARQQGFSIMEEKFQIFGVICVDLY